MNGSLQIRAVFFDLGGTLLDFRDPEGWSHVAAEVGLVIEPEHLAHAVADLERLTDGPNRVEGSGFWQRALALASGRDVPVHTARLFLDRWSSSPRDGRLFSDVRPCLEELRRDRRRLGVISNSRSEDAVRAQLAATAILPYFAAVVSSGSEGVQKPDKAIFDRAASKIGVENRATFHVGDLPYTDAKGAALAGFQSVWLNRTGTGFGDDPPEITSLTELPGYLRELEGRSR